MLASGLPFVEIVIWLPSAFRLMLAVLPSS